MIVITASSLATTMSVHRRIREPNLYGYLYSVLGKKVPWPGIQLQTVLNMQNNVQGFRSLKKDILHLMQKHLDINLTGTEQVNKLRTIENELKKRHPELFAAEESEKKLYFATRMILHDHANRRHRKKQNRQQLTEASSQSSSILTRNQRKNQPRAGSKRDCDNHEMPESASQTLPRSNDSSTGSRRDTAHKKRDSSQYRDIRSFLETSTPPMTHLMDAFIDFGCVNAEFLLAISSWSIEGIQGVLDRLSLPDGRELTEMEKYILQDHFKEYFNQLEKRGNSMNESDS